MDSSHLVDPELRGFLEAFPNQIFGADMLEATRDAIRNHFTVLIPEGFPVTSEIIFIAGPAGAPPVKLIICKPKDPNAANAPRPVVYYMHGGGYVVGKPERSLIALHEMADLFQCVVVAVSYRLAPETSHPGPLEDCYAGLKWVYDNAGNLGADKTKIAASGESAGGGLAAALALLARDRGEVPLIYQFLRCPMLDDRTCVMREPHPYTGQYLWPHNNNDFGWQSLLGEPPGSDNISLYAAAARAGNLAGLPPAFIAVGALDLFLEESLEYARRLSRAGIPLELHIYQGGFHGFEAVAAARVAQDARRDYVAAMNRALNA